MRKKPFSRSLEQFFLTVGQNNFGNKIPFFNDEIDKVPGFAKDDTLLIISSV